MPSFLNELLGTKPTVPTLPSLSLPAEQQKALAANIAAIPQSEQIATQVDLFNQQQVDQMLTHVIPNYQAIAGNIGKNIASLTAGQIPGDVAEAVAQSAASQALGGGYGGTGAGRSLQARDLGLTSLQLTAQGLNSAESWMRTAGALYQPGNFNVSSMFITPGQQASFDVEERNAQFQQQWMQNQIAAQPAMWAQDFKEAVQTAISIYSHTPPQHAGTLPVSNFSGSSFDDSGGFTASTPSGSSATISNEDFSQYFPTDSGPGTSFGAGGTTDMGGAGVEGISIAG